MNIAEKIDHTILRADAREEEVKKYCQEAVQYHFASVCVNTCHVPLVAELLKGSGVKVCCVVGFPLGAMSTRAKAYEAQAAVEDGAEEVDMVINIGDLKDKAYDRIKEEITRLKAACGGYPRSCDSQRRRGGESHTGNLPADQRGDRGNLPPFSEGRGGICKNFNRIFDRRRYC